MDYLDSKLTLKKVKESFTISGLWLLCIGFYILAFCFFIKDNLAKTILLSETIVLIIASFVYSIFIKDTHKKDFKLSEITKYRYMDWVLTTPLILFSFTLFLSHYNNFNLKNKNILNFQKYVIMFFLNLCMLGLGYLGEIGKLDKNIALILSFIFFGLLFLFIWYNFVFMSGSMIKYIIFLLFTTIWGLYGVSFMFKDKLKNYSYNILDTIAKGLFGFLLLKYYLFKNYF